MFNGKSYLVAISEGTPVFISVVSF